MKLTEEQLTALIRRHRALDGDLAALREEMLAIKEQIDGDVESGWKFTVDGITASKREANRDFDLALAWSELTPEERDACKAVKLDPKLVRELIEKKGVLENCMTRKEDAKPVVKL